MKSKIQAAFEQYNKTGEKVVMNLGIVPNNDSLDKLNQPVYDTTAKAMPFTSNAHQGINRAIVAMPPLQSNPYTSQNIQTERRRIYSDICQYIAETLSQSQLPNVLFDHDNSIFFKALIEWEATQMSDYEWKCFLEPDDYVNYRWQRPHSIIAFVSEKFNISLTQSMLALGRYFDIYPENVFRTFPQSKHATKVIQQHRVTEYIPQQLNAEGTLYTLCKRDYQYDYCGEIEQVIYTYTRHDGANFNVIASRAMYDNESIIKIGNTPTVTKFLSSTHIDGVHRPTVIICTELETALNLRNFAQETKLYDNCGIIISGYFGGDEAIASLNYTVLFGADVIIVPTATSSGLNEAKELLAKCTTAGVISVKIFLGVVAFANTVLPEANNTLSSWLQYFWSKSVTVSHKNPLSLVTTHIRDTAIDATGFQKWQIEHALTTPEANTSTASPTLCISALNAIAAVNRDSSLPVTTDDFFIPSYTNLIWGPSDIGKTWVIVEICICVILGLPTFFLAKPIGVRKEHVITILDGENEDSTLKQRFTQLLENKGYNKDTLNSKIYIAGLEPGKNLSDADEQEKLLSALRSNSTTLLVIDNLLSLMPDAASGKSKYLFELIARIKEMGIIVIVVHHAGKQGNTLLGSSTLESLSQNIIELSRLGDEESKKYQKDGGAFYLKLQVTKCKVPGNTFANKMAIYTLPSGRGWQQLEGNLPYYNTEISNGAYDIHPSDTPSTDATDPIRCQAESLPQLHPDDVKLYKFMKSQSSFTKANIQEYLGASEGTARNKINYFINLKLIERHGGKNNKNTYYTVTQ